MSTPITATLQSVALARTALAAGDTAATDQHIRAALTEAYLWPGTSRFVIDEILSTALDSLGDGDDIAVRALLDAVELSAPRVLGSTEATA